jgi:glucosyl-dolichyl phosphate glucuronosyltransferase
LIVTVAICTWNRAKLLDQTLAAMQHLSIPAGIEWELLVVNNNCSDETDAVIARYASRLPIRSLHEPRPGKSYAANLALSQAKGQLLLWTDDDVLVDPDWLFAYVQAASDWPRASFFAGAVRPWFEKEPPRWLRYHLPRLKGVYVIADSGNEVREWQPSDGIYGANMAFRMDVARQFPLNPVLGRIQGHLIGGDDTELIERVIQAGHTGVWLPTASVQHFIPAERLSKVYVRKWYAGAGSNMVRQGAIGNCRRILGMPRWVLASAIKQSAYAAILSPGKGRLWLQAYTNAARLWGIIQEMRKKPA